MKTIAQQYTVFLFLFTILTAAQPVTLKFGTMEARIEFAKKNIAFGLHSENSGVVESLLMLTAKLAVTHPTENMTKIVSIVDSLAVSSTSAPLRYKAYIVSNICSDPAWFDQNDLKTSTIPDHFFMIAARRLERKMLGISSR
ncbi:MAG: hypothetical protein WDA22_15995 [Bacteroidota bacterium]